MFPVYVDFLDICSRYVYCGHCGSCSQNVEFTQSVLGIVSVVTSYCQVAGIRQLFSQ